MPVTRRERTIAADQQRIWEVIEDPHHMPRWWPGVKRMEGVEEERFTQVFFTKRGRSVRMDFRLLVSEPPWRRVWEQEVSGTPFERVLGQSVTEIVLEPASAGVGAEASAGGTRITLVQDQKLKGYSRTGGFLLRRATRKRLDEALEGLERIC